MPRRTKLTDELIGLTATIVYRRDESLYNNSSRRRMLNGEAEGDLMTDDGFEGTILLDVAAGAGDFDRDLLERFGHPVKVCHGPEHGAICPLLAGRGCDDFAGAHGVIFELDLDRPQHRAIVHRYRELARPEVPIRVITTSDQAVRYARDLAGIEILTHEPTAADLDGFAAEVEAADRGSR